MKNKTLDQTIFRVAAETIEALALMFLIPEEDVLEGCKATKAARVDFSGSFDGSLVVWASEGLLGNLAANMLGQDSSAHCPREHQDDALKELANVICGNLLPALAGEQIVFHVGAPVIFENITPSIDEQDQHLAGRARLVLYEGELEIRLYTDQASEIPLATKA